MMLTAAMLVRNEEGRYLERVLSQLAAVSDRLVVLDDASTDGTAGVCRAHGAEVTCRRETGFANEVLLRKHLWGLAEAARPDWILCLDADETFEGGSLAWLRTDLSDADMAGADAVAFRLFDMWDASHYRDDALWTAHRRWWTLCVRWRPDFPYRWRETAQHCGRFPVNAGGVKVACSPVRVQHWGWARPEDRERKFRRYMSLDPDGKHGSLAQYRSIMDPEPNLVEWEG